MKLDINNIFILTKYNLDMLKEILEFSRPNRSFKSKTAALIKDSLKLRDTVFNPIVYKNDQYVVFWKTREKMPLGIYRVYRKWHKSPFYERWCNK